MKKFYSILALAFMCMVGVANAQETKSVEFIAKNNSSLTRTVDGIKFSLEEMTWSEGHFIQWGENQHWEDIYLIPQAEGDNYENATAYIKWENVPEGKQIHITSITIKGRCYRYFGSWTSHSMDIFCNYYPENKVNILRNNYGSYSNWPEVTISAETLSADGLKNDAHLIIANGGGAAQLQEIKIKFYLENTKSVYRNDNDVVFEGDWNESEISERLEQPVGGLDTDNAGIIDITGVTGLNSTTEIIPQNPNTLIEANEGQYNGSHNVIVDGVINNLVVVDPLVSGDPQDGQAYNSKCTWNLKREGLKAAKASYTRPMTYKYATVAIPFDYNTSDINAQVEEITDMNLSEGEIVTNKIEADGVAAGDAVIVWANGDIVINAENCNVATAPRTGGILNGTFKEENIGMGQYAIAMDQFWNAGYAERNTMIVKPFRAWFGRPESTENNAKVLSIVSADATAIKNVEAAATIAPAYNLQGVRVAPNAKGFVIVNGKKYFNK